jgi:transglutaminase-like putative cysteine protease
MYKPIAVALLFLLVCAAGFADDFKPISPAELAMKEMPGAPGAHAVILEYSTDQNDTDSYEDEYYRIKVFDEEGKKHGDIELTYFKNVSNIGSIKARVVQPDGTVIPFKGKVYEKTVVKYRGSKVQAKALSLPDIRPGSIIEYKYRRSWGNYLYTTRWTLQRELFMKKASYSLDPYTRMGSYWMAIGLPPGKEIVKKGNRITLELENVPAFDEERFSPPEEQLKGRVEFFYSDRDVEKPDKFWPRIGKESYANVESFVNKRSAMTQAVQEIIAPSDAPEAKLRKIYARVQQLRNLEYERDRSEQEQKREKLKDSNNVEDVWKRGYGYRVELNRLFLALARAAGFDATAVLVSRRDEVFFNQNLPDARQLNSEIVYVRTPEGKEYYLDPGVPHCRFGTLRWSKTGVAGLKLAKDGATFINTPQPDIGGAVTKRLVRLRYEDGAFKGKLSLLFDGLEALNRRLDYLEEDEQEFRDELEKEVKDALPGGSTVKFVNFENARATDEPLIVHFDVELPDFSSSVGSRRLIPLTIFQTSNPFRHEQRKHPVYYSYPFQEVDQIAIEVPEGFTVESVPAARKLEPAFAYYDTKWDNDAKLVTLTRRFAILGYFFPVHHYASLRDFYSRAATGDQDNVVLRARSTTAAK